MSHFDISQKFLLRDVIWESSNNGIFRSVISQKILVVPILDRFEKIAYFANSYIVNSENIGSARALWAH